MKLAQLTWPEVDALDRARTVVLLPTGSLEQHGPHLPLFTDSLLVTAVAEAVEAHLPEQVLLLPTLWLGASGHHLGFPGTVSASLAGYQQAVVAALDSLAQNGFLVAYIVNGHGGNTSGNDLAVRELKTRFPNITVGAAGYFEFIAPTVMEQTLTGPFRTIRHACEAETSLMLHCHPQQVRMDRAVDDGLDPVPFVPGLGATFAERTQDGVLGCATLGTAEKGRVLFEAAVTGLAEACRALSEGIHYQGR